MHSGPWQTYFPIEGCNGTRLVQVWHWFGELCICVMPGLVRYACSYHGKTDRKRGDFYPEPIEWTIGLCVREAGAGSSAFRFPIAPLQAVDLRQWQGSIRIPGALNLKCFIPTPAFFNTWASCALSPNTAPVKTCH